MRLTVLLAALVLAVPFASQAARPAAPTAGQLALMHAVDNFSITDGFFERDLALAVDMAQDPCGHGDPLVFFRVADEVGKGALTVDQASQQLAAQPGMAALLAKHGLSVRDAFIGGLAMMNATMETMPMPAGTTSSGGSDSATGRANAAFFKAHMAQVQANHAKIGAIAQQRLKANGGKLPPCERSIFEHARAAHAPH